VDEPRRGVSSGSSPGQAIRRGSFDSVPDLVAAIRAFIDAYNTRRKPFVWTKTADEILPRATRKPTSDAGH
jgi:hypothetical protein